jgi:hypothetical protein
VEQLGEGFRRLAAALRAAAAGVGDVDSALPVCDAQEPQNADAAAVEASVAELRACRLSHESAAREPRKSTSISLPHHPAGSTASLQTLAMALSTREEGQASATCTCASDVDAASSEADDVVACNAPASTPALQC